MNRHFQHSLIVLISIILGLSACNQQAGAPKTTVELITAHKWQLVDEQGLNLPSESLGDNIIELNKDGSLVYYENREKVNVFTKNQWKLASNEKMIVETLPDGSIVKSEIVELNERILKLRYKESDGLGGTSTIVETYEKFIPRIAALKTD